MVGFVFFKCISYECISSLLFTTENICDSGLKYENVSSYKIGYI